MNQTKFYFPLIFISLEDEPWEPIEPNPNAAPAEEPVAAEPGLSVSDWTLASTETVTHEYLTQSGRVARETIRQSVGGTVLSTKTLDFFYDDSGRPFAFNYSVDGGIASTYYYILNLQGDVVQIIDANGVMQAEYVYSPWGEIISAEGNLEEVNPLRYRGYYYDSETGFHYLRSRYYDPENHRFINTDCIESSKSNPNLQVRDSYRCTMKYQMKAITSILLEYAEGTEWKRTQDSLITEWREHNRYAWASARAKHVDFDNKEEGKGFFYFLGKAMRSIWEN